MKEAEVRGLHVHRERGSNVEVKFDVQAEETQSETEAMVAEPTGGAGDTKSMI